MRATLVRSHDPRCPDEAPRPEQEADPEPAFQVDRRDLLALLRRVGDGECGFRPEDRSDEAGERFDMLVEHLLAMRERGWVTFRAPVGEMRRPGRTYVAVSDVELTDEGRAVLGRGQRVG